MFKKIKKQSLFFFGKLKKTTFPKTKTFIKKRPMASFFVALLILFVAIIANSLISSKSAEPASEPQPKKVEVYKIGEAPKVSFSGMVEKEGVVQIVAQMPGIVSSVNVFEGEEVARGRVIIELANNYTGGSTASVQRQIAGAQYKNVKDTYDAQKELLSKQREVANKTRENSDELRRITEDSVDDTRGLVDLNNTIINTIEENLRGLVDNNVGGANDQAILQTQQLLSQVRAGNIQLNQGLRTADFQVGEDNPPNELSELSLDIALKQLDVQEKALALNREVAGLQVRLAQIAESMMVPASPFDGIVERVNVVPGQFVSPGTPLATIGGFDKKASVIVKVPQRVAREISLMEESELFINGKTYMVVPKYVSTEATDGQLYSVIFALPEELVGKITNRDFIQVKIPIGVADSIVTIPYLPIDIVYQTQDASFVYTVKDAKVVAHKVTLGEVVGSNVSVMSGLSNGDQVILNRNIVAGERVEVEN